MKYNFNLIFISFGLALILAVVSSQTNPTREITCKDNEWRCANKRQCIPRNYLCDKLDDCIDGSDEQNCDNFSTQSTKKTTPKSTTRTVTSKTTSKTTPKSTTRIVSTSQKPITGPVETRKCGQPPIKPITSNSRIVGGVTSKPFSWPWHVSVLVLKDNDSHIICGGTIINQTTILTSANCLNFNTSLAKRVMVMAGIHDLNTKADILYQGVRVAKIFIPDEKPMSHDIAILVLLTRLFFRENVAPICVPRAPPTDELNCYSTGWGSTNGQLPTNTLNQARTPIINWDVCKQKYNSNLTQFQVCAGQNGTGTCLGDSGGPLACQSKNSRWYLYGVASGGTANCTTNDKPSYYADVYKYYEWIVAKTGFTF